MMNQLEAERDIRKKLTLESSQVFQGNNQHRIQPDQLLYLWVKNAVLGHGKDPGQA